MARNNKVMNLWTVLVTAFLALFAALGLASSTTAAAAPQTEAPQRSTAPAPLPATPHWSWSWSWSEARALPPTMKQRIGAEAHGKTPSCRHSPLDDTAATILSGLTAPAPLTC
ncbi:DUF6344 domain-containing protein [Streptomyces shenzhenensis]|uniref:DUF6344 domain-containing protein n=1 Tax=Streptomyces shenzhenensis TaxID=943815 RepID=UPI0033C05645